MSLTDMVARDREQVAAEPGGLVGWLAVGKPNPNVVVGHGRLAIGSRWRENQEVWLDGWLAVGKPIPAIRRN